MGKLYAAGPLAEAFETLLNGSLSVPYYGTVPENSELPYVSLGPIIDSETEEDKLSYYRNVTVQLDVWTAKDRKTENQNISQELLTLLGDRSCSLSSTSFDILHWSSNRTEIEDPEGLIIHSALELSLELRQI